MFLLGMGFFILMTVSGIYALTNSKTNETFSTDFVNVEIKVTSTDNTKKGTNIEVSPGDIVALTPKIYNLAGDCYLRVKVNYIDESIDFLDYVTGFSTNFKKYGEYYYYDGVFGADEVLNLFDTIKIPSNGYKGNLKLQIIAQAVQYRNFEPDYTSENPWGNVTPTECQNTYYDIESGTSKLSVNYEDGINSDITFSDGNNGSNRLLPGDSLISSIEIKNSNKKDAKYYLKFGINEEYTKEVDFLNKLDLIITNKDGQVIYSGKIENNKKIYLEELSLNQYDKSEMKVTVPVELGNEYANLNPEISLTFSAEYNQNEIIEDPTNEKTKEDSKENETKNVKTGDSIDVSLLIFLISSVGLVIVMLLEYKRRKENL